MAVLEQLTSQNAIELENKYGAHNYHPLPVVLTKGEGVYVWDVDGKKYYDFLSAYSAVNQGHSHPKIVNALINQAQTLALTSRAFYNDVLGEFEKMVCEFFDYDKVLAMNSGAEAVETAIKVCRKYAYEKRGIPENQAKIIVCDGNFHGRTTTIISFSNDDNARDDYGPYTPGFKMVEYNNIDALKNEFESNPNIVAYMVEPIQGEAGIIIPDEGYLKKVRKLCDEYNVLLIADEIQTGLGRTGKLMACDYDDIKPDMLLLGKALSGGLMPISCVLADNHVMKHMGINMHGSTYGGNPLSAVIAESAVRYTIDNKLQINSFQMGIHFRDELQRIQHKYSYIKDIRGKGLMNAIQCEDAETASTLVTKLRENNILTKTTHDTTLRMTPPLIINKKQINKSLELIEKAMNEV